MKNPLITHLGSKVLEWMEYGIDDKSAYFITAKTVR